MAQSAFSKAIATQVVSVSGGQRDLAVDTILDLLDRPSRRDAIANLMDGSVQHATIARAFAAMEPPHSVATSSIARWRKEPEKRVERKANGDRK